MVRCNKQTLRAHNDITTNRHETRPQKLRPWANASPFLQDKPARETDTLAYDGSRMGPLYDKTRQPDTQLSSARHQRWDMSGHDVVRGPGAPPLQLVGAEEPP